MPIPHFYENAAPAIIIFFLVRQSNHVGNRQDANPYVKESNFASGLSQPEGLAFDSKGNLFVADREASTIYQYSGGVRSHFATVDFSDFARVRFWRRSLRVQRQQ